MTGTLPPISQSAKLPNRTEINPRAPSISRGRLMNKLGAPAAKTVNTIVNNVATKVPKKPVGNMTTELGGNKDKIQPRRDSSKVVPNPKPLKTKPGETSASATLNTLKRGILKDLAISKAAKSDKKKTLSGLQDKAGLKKTLKTIDKKSKAATKKILDNRSEDTRRNADKTVSKKKANTKMTVLAGKMKNPAKSKANKKDVGKKKTDTGNSMKTNVSKKAAPK
ncbi:hypothetical protein M8J75_003158 [Diaphorina citri]|nr:hypothetical protein M8J75_003158 [Diaphorina citri]